MFFLVRLSRSDPLAAPGARNFIHPSPSHMPPPENHELAAAEAQAKAKAKPKAKPKARAMIKAKAQGKAAGKARAAAKVKHKAKARPSWTTSDEGSESDTRGDANEYKPEEPANAEQDAREQRAYRAGAFRAGTEAIYDVAGWLMHHANNCHRLAARDGAWDRMDQPLPDRPLGWDQFLLTKATSQTLKAVCAGLGELLS